MGIGSQIKRYIFGEKVAGSVGVGFYYFSFRKVISTNFRKRFYRSEKFILSSERNFYYKDRVVKIPHFLDEFDSSVITKSARGIPQVNIGGKPYTLSLVDISGGRSFGGRRLYEIKGLTRDLITTKRKNLSVYCIWVDPDNRISSEKYNTPGNLRMFFNGPVKAFSPVVRNHRDGSVNKLCTSIYLSIFISTVIPKGAVYLSMELVDVLFKAISRIILPIVFCFSSFLLISLGLPALPLMSGVRRKEYLSNYSSAFNAACRMFISGMADYIRINILDSEAVLTRLESVNNGSLQLGGSERASLELKKGLLSCSNIFTGCIHLPLICARGITNIFCSSVRAIASTLCGVLTLDTSYFKAAAFLLKEPFKEMKDDLKESFGGKIQEVEVSRDQVIGFDRELFDLSVAQIEQESKLSTASKFQAASLGSSLRKMGVSSSRGDASPFIPSSCKAVMKGL